MLRNLLYLFWILCWPGMLFSQSVLQGTVQNQDTGEALPGVNVYIPELSLGAISNGDGYYEITQIPNGEFIVLFSYVGFQTLHRIIRFDGDKQEVKLLLSPSVIEGEEVVISGNFTSTQHDNTIKISTLGIEEINRSTIPSLIASLREVPGVNLISKGPGVVTPVIRGLSLNNILVLKNGLPLQNFQFSEDHPYLLSENGLSHAEVIKGPASLIYGSGAVGGVINMIPEPVAAEGTIRGKFDLRYFSNTVGALSNLTVQGNQKGILWGVGGGINSHKDYLQGTGEFAPNTRFNSYNVNADLGLIRKKGVFRVFYSRNASLFGMAVAPAIQIVTENGRKNQYWYQDLTDDLVNSQNRFFLGDFKLDLDLSYQNNHRKLHGEEEGDHAELVDMTLQTISYRAKVTHSISPKVRYIVGTQGMFQENRNGDAPERILPDASIRDISIYGLFQYNINAVKLEAGLRYNYVSIFVPYQEAAGGHDHEEEEEGNHQEPEYISFDSQYDNLSASLGATFQVSESSLIRANLASAFRSPNLAELTQQGRHGLRYEEGNPDLDMQQNLEVDLGYHLHTQHTTLDLSLFYNHIFNYIHLAPSADSTDEGDRIYRYMQAEARLYGAEASLHIHPHPLDWLHLKASYAMVYGEYTDGSYLPRIPANDLSLEVRLVAEKWKGLRDLYLEGGMDFVFAQNRPAQFEMTTPAYQLVNLGAGFDIQLKRNRIHIHLQCANLLDVSYYDHLSTLRDLGLYNIGRNFMAGLSVPFNLKN
jgi:iron complex outermembrane recepter protein